MILPRKKGIITPRWVNTVATSMCLLASGAPTPLAFGHYSRNPPALQRQGGFFMPKTKLHCSCSKNKKHPHKNACKPLWRNGLQHKRILGTRNDPGGCRGTPQGRSGPPGSTPAARGVSRLRARPGQPLKGLPGPRLTFLLSPRSKQEPPPLRAAAPLHSVFRVTLSRVKG